LFSSLLPLRSISCSLLVQVLELLLSSKGSLLRLSVLVDCFSVASFCMMTGIVPFFSGVYVARPVIFPFRPPPVLYLDNRGTFPPLTNSVVLFWRISHSCLRVTLGSSSSFFSPLARHHIMAFSWSRGDSHLLPFSFFFFSRRIFSSNFVGGPSFFFFSVPLVRRAVPCRLMRTNLYQTIPPFPYPIFPRFFILPSLLVSFSIGVVYSWASLCLICHLNTYQNLSPPFFFGLFR